MRGTAYFLPDAPVAGVLSEVDRSGDGESQEYGFFKVELNEACNRLTGHDKTHDHAELTAAYSG